MNIELSLKEALTGWKRTVTTIDGKNLVIEKGGPTQTATLTSVCRFRRSQANEATLS
jgi:DnaJ family protein B protein 4